MGNILIILAILETIFIVMFANYNLVEDIQLGIMYTQYNFTLSFFALCLILYSLGILAGVLFMLRGVHNTNKQYSLLKRKFEKTSVDSDDSELKIRTLENKIQTLETALDKALKDK